MRHEHSVKLSKLPKPVTVIFEEHGDINSTYFTYCVIETANHEFFSGVAKYAARPDDEYNSNVAKRTALKRAVRAFRHKLGNVPLRQLYSEFRKELFYSQEGIVKTAVEQLLGCLTKREDVWWMAGELVDMLVDPVRNDLGQHTNGCKFCEVWNSYSPELQDMLVNWAKERV